MDKTNFMRRIVAFVMAWLIIFNCGDVGLLKGIVRLQTAEADTSAGLTTTELQKLWIKQKQSDAVEGWFKTPNTNKDDIADGFWKDTSNLKVMRINEENVEVETKSDEDMSLGKCITNYTYDGIVADYSKAVKEDGTIGSIDDGNVYDGTRYENGLYYTIEKSESLGGYYRKYYVSTARQLSALLYYYGDDYKYTSSHDSTKKTVSYTIARIKAKDGGISKFNSYLKATENDKPVNKLGIVLLCDIDLGGANKQLWTGYSNQEVTLEIDGNGHTIYNGSYSNSASYFIGHQESHVFNTLDKETGNETTETTQIDTFFADSKFSIHDVTFSNQYLTRSQGMFGDGVKYTYFNNVDWKDCFATSESTKDTSVTIVLGKNYLDCYFKSCNISNSYIKGNGTGHCGFFASFNGSTAAIGTYMEYTGDLTNRYYTEIPESFDEVELLWRGNQKSSLENEKTLSNSYPSIYEDCSVIDSNLYEMSDTAYHSGVFVSCMQGNIIFRNCYTNGSIYGYQQLGAFIGGVIGSVNGFTYPAIDNESEDTRVNAYFENCYAAGTVEGTKKLGGFVGMIFNDGRAVYDVLLNTPVVTQNFSTKRGKAVFKNCYTTASVGMEYSGSEIGGFVGVMRGNVNGCSINSDSWKKPNDNGKMNVVTISSADLLDEYIGTVTDDDELELIALSKKHRFINCYAAGEVGGIGTNNSTDDINTNSIGGFVGVYRPADYVKDDGKTHYTDAVDMSQIMTNCYYDKQTTAMRERDIGCYNKAVSNYMTSSFKIGNVQYKGKVIEDEIMNKASNYNLCHTLSGLTGVYTQQSVEQQVMGLTSVDGISENIMNDVDGTWVYVQGYYPQLSVFYNADGASADFGSAEKADKAKLYSQASTATVFLEHWDEIMNDSDGNLTGDGADNVYDTVRDISAKFSFTSDGNSAEGNLGWQLNEERNNESDFATYLGVPNTGDESTDSNFNVTFYTKDNEEGDAMNKTYSPNVLLIGAEKNEKNKKYIFECFDYASGKQFVKVTTCHSDKYNEWAEQQEKYDEYFVLEAQYEINRAGLVEVVNRNQTLTDDELNVLLRAEIVKIVKKANDSSYTDEQVRELALEAYKTADDYINNVITDKEKVTAVLNIEDNLSAEDFRSAVALKHDALENYIDIDATEGNNTKYPIAKPQETYESDPTDFAGFAGESYGTRTFRLIPQSYLNAGDTIKVTVMQSDPTEDNPNSEITNSVTIISDSREYTLDRFNHTVGVVYASTQGMPLWLGSYDQDKPTLKSRLADKDIYSGQKIIKRSLFYNTENTEKDMFDLDEMEKNDYFTVYSYYPSYWGEGETEYDAEAGFTGLIKKRSVGSFYPNGYHDSIDSETDMGMTMVRVFRAEEVSDSDSDGDVTSFTLEKLEDSQIDMSDSDNLAKWSGEKPFEVSDSGYYYMTYYWRLNDGRYRTEDKLVSIDANNYNVYMRTGVADAETDSFSSDESSLYTDIDCDVILDEEQYNDGGLKGYSFPSDKYDAEYKENGTSWEDYANEAYNDIYDETIVYPEVDGTSYWAKGVVKTTGAGNVTVAWRKNADYRLDKLIVRVRKGTGKNSGWQNMTVVKFDTAGKASIDTDSTIKYQYSYASLAVKQNERTKQFSVIKTDSTVREFGVSNQIGIKDDVVQYINFNFIDSAVGQSMVQLSDDIMVMALFSKVAATVDIEKYALVDDGKSETGLVSENSGTDKALYLADRYRSIDNVKYDDDEKRAVMFGDTVIYRMRLQNTGYYNASNVVVYDTVPKGCTFVPNSVVVYKQKKSYDDPTKYTYDELENCNVVAKAITDTELNNYATRWCRYSYSESDNKLTFLLNPINRQYDYYIQYKATVDEDYQAKDMDFSNTADYTYAYINGGTVETDSAQNFGDEDDGDTGIDDSDTTETEDNGEFNEYYPSKAIFNVTSNDSGNKYVLNFTGQAEDVSNYEIDSITNRLPNGYELDGDVTITGYNSSAIELSISQDGTEFTIKPKADGALTFSTSDKLTIEFSIKAKSGTDTSKKRSNYSAITYHEKGSGVKKQNAVTKTDSSSNTVESVASWLYLDVKKVIPEEDDTQAFLFKLVGDSINKTMFTDVYADTEEDGCYTGNSLIQILKRGAYTLTETDWANTDYDVDSASYAFEDIDFKDEDIKNGQVIIADGKGVSFNLPRAMYDSTAFPLWAVDGDDGIIYPTITCTNQQSQYAWLTSQNNVTNSFSVGDVQASTYSKATARRSVPRDTTTSPQAVLNTAVLELKKDEDEEV